MRRFEMKLIAVLLMVISTSACGSKSSTTPSTTATPVNTPVAAAKANEAKPESSHESSVDDSSKPSKRRSYAPIDMGVGEKSTEASTKSATEQLESIRAALKPFQVLLGKWNGLSRKAVADHPEWAYDWVSDPKKPALRLRSKTGVYIRDGRLSYSPVTDNFEFKSTDAEGAEHTFRGTFTEPIRDVIGDEKKPQRTYKLTLTEPEANASGEQWRITFNQQENNRYILEIERKRGNGPFNRIDTIHTQREGTSFALSDSDFGSKTCIISQGLGTISVSYKGQSFWVCCTGCKAAFEDDPEKWIAKWELKKKAMEK